MKHIEFKDHNYTYRYDFPEKLSSEEAFDPSNVIYIEDDSNPELCLRICIDFLQDIYGEKAVKKALDEFVL